MDNRRQQRLAFIVTAAIFTILQLLSVVRAPTSVSLAKGTDYWEYLELAAGIRHGCGFARYVNGVCEQPEILRTPGYPLFVAIFPNWRVVLFAQALLSGLVCLLAGIWTGHRWGTLVGCAAQMFIFANIPSFVLSAMLMSETLFEAVLFLAILLPLLQFNRARGCSSLFVSAATSGVLIGCLSLIRPVAVFIPILGFIPYLLLDSPAKQKITAIALTIVIPTAVILGWSVRNYILKGYFGLSTVSALNLYLYRAGGVLALDTGRPLWKVQDAMINEIGAANLQLYGNEVTPDLAKEMNRRALHILASHPLEATMVTVQGFVWLLVAPSRTMLARLLGTPGGSTELGPGSGRVTVSRIRRIVGQVRQSYVLTALVVFQFLFVAVVWTGIFRAVRKVPKSSVAFRAWIIYLLSIATLLLITASGAEAAVRFRSVVMPLLGIVAAMGYFGEAAHPPAHIAKD